MLKLYNTLTHKVEEFKSLKDGVVTMYSCGPTVYDYQHIGHMRRYVNDDILLRVLKFNGYKVNHAMNITDVGHLVSDSDIGEDKMEKGARKFGKSVWDIAKMFEKQFVDSCSKLNIALPKNLMHATDYIKEQVELIKILEKKGFTYKISDGIYFDTSKFKDYFKLSMQNPEELKKGARVDFVEGKRNIADFALWKFSLSANSGLKRDMEWDSPWGIGFPGWHIECSAMSMKALGESLDIHTGGIDHISIHHTNEIAQSEAVTGKKFVNYWAHHNFLTVEAQKMSKSLGNFYTVADVVDKTYSPMALRYLYLQTHYRQEMNFTWEALEAAQTAYNRLIGEISKFKYQNSNSSSNSNVMESFISALNDDLNTPKALAVMWEMVKSNINDNEKIRDLSIMDQLLGLQLFVSSKLQETSNIIPEKVQVLVEEREQFRKAGDYAASDEIREKISVLGFKVKDTRNGPEVTKN